jgi:hypothetical protein
MNFEHVLSSIEDKVSVGDFPKLRADANAIQRLDDRLMLDADTRERLYEVFAAGCAAAVKSYQKYLSTKKTRPLLRKEIP